jgi:hypothetical protein
MAYILNKTDGTPLVTLPDKTTTGKDYSVTFIGKNYLSYGEALNESLLHLLENSASSSAARPVNPVIGQTWYNKTDNTLYVCYQERTGLALAKFRALANSNTGAGTPSNPNIGDIWYDPTASADAASGSLKIYVGPPRGWITVGPQVQSNWTQTDINQTSYIKNRPETFAPTLRILYGNNEITKQTTKTINFTGTGVTANLVNGTFDSVVVNIPGSGANSSAVSIGASAPPNPVAGTLWYENAKLGRGFIYDGAQWVDFSPAIDGGAATPTPVDPTKIPIAASTSFTLATTDGTAKSMGVVLTPGTWQVILDTRIGSTTNYSGAFTATQSATVGATTVATQVRVYNGSSATQVSGKGAFSAAAAALASAAAAAITQSLNKDILNSTSDIAVGEIIITSDTAVVMDMQAVGVSDPILQPIGSTLTLSKIASTDAQKIYSGTMPTFTMPAAAGLGVGQSWKSLTDNRAKDTPYQNTTGKPIMVVVLPASYNIVTLLVSSDNINWVNIGIGSAFASSDNSIGAIVPDQHWYKTSGNHRNWVELR